ncbi:5505_t:CDS:2 [Acaulospora morrowiae]|uniref:5505_t:CDS:1 n=1 Tax=Acaulospora morrowiae TaxID=94023 RepID=A0A9N8W3M0_9GLOM|nr:5505_t:CDS:2 [Acaulospora morrowiae]
MFSKQGNENGNESLGNNNNQIGQNQVNLILRELINAMCNTGADTKNASLEVSISVLTQQVQELVAHYAKLVITTTIQPGHRMRTKLDLQDIMCYKSEMEAQYVEIMEDENEINDDPGITSPRRDQQREPDPAHERETKYPNDDEPADLKEELDEILDEDVKDMEEYYTKDTGREEVTFPEELSSPAAYLSQIEKLPTIITEYKEIVTMEGIEQIEVSEKLGSEKQD